MLPTLFLAAAASAPGAPIPRDAVPNASGPAPRLLAVKANSNGQVWITGTVLEKRKINVNQGVNENGKVVVKQVEQEVNVSNYINKQIGDFGAKFATVDGAELSAEEVVKRVKNGGVLLITADGKPIGKGWLRAISADTIVMQTDSLNGAHFQWAVSNGTLPQTPAPRLAMLCSDDEGKVRLAVNPNAAQGQAYANDMQFRGGFRGRVGVMVVNGNVVQMDNFDGPALPATDVKPADADGKKSLSNLTYEAYDSQGKLVSKPQVEKRLAAGGFVLIADDSRLPDAAYLKGLHEDVLILVSHELVFPQGMPNPYDAPVNKGKNAPATGPQVIPPGGNLVPLPAVRPAIARPAVLIKNANVVPAPAPIQAVPALPQKP